MKLKPPGCRCPTQAAKRARNGSADPGMVLKCVRGVHRLDMQLFQNTAARIVVLHSEGRRLNLLEVAPGTVRLQRISAPLCVTGSGAEQGKCQTLTQSVQQFPRIAARPSLSTLGTIPVAPARHPGKVSRDTGQTSKRVASQTRRRPRGRCGCDARRAKRSTRSKLVESLMVISVSWRGA